MATTMTKKAATSGKSTTTTESGITPKIKAHGGHQTVSFGSPAASSARLRYVRRPWQAPPFEKGEDPFLTRQRAFVETKIGLIHNPSFEEADENGVLRDQDGIPVVDILGPVPEAGRRCQKRKPPNGLPPYLAALYETPLLDREQEVHLFRKMNFLRFRARALQKKVLASGSAPGKRAVATFEHLLKQAAEVNRTIVQANLRLVVSIAKKHIYPGVDFFELVSDGNISLIRAVDKFDYSRGNKFGTYASWAIMKNFSRTIPDDLERASRFATGSPEGIMDEIEDRRANVVEQESALQQNQLAVGKLLDQLDERERTIIIARFALKDRDEETLTKLGRQLGITKERVRQIQNRALARLRRNNEQCLEYADD